MSAFKVVLHLTQSERVLYEGEDEARAHALFDTVKEVMRGVELYEPPVLPDHAEELQRLRLISAAATRLVHAVGEPAKCSSPMCGEPVWWIIHRNGKKAPYNADGIIHFATCPAAREFRRAE